MSIDILPVLYYYYNNMTKSQAAPIQTFGELFRQNRIALGLTLRSFCERFGYDPAYISRIERDILAPPEDKEKIQAFAKALNIKEGKPDWVTFFDLAYIAKGKIPSDITAKDESLKHLPLLFRTMRGEKLSLKKLQQLIRLLNKS